MAKSGQPADDDLSGVEEIEIEKISPTITQKIDEFIAKQKLQDESITFYLYKYDDPRNGETKSLINKYQDCDAPDEHEIGMDFGSGRYLLMMSVPRQSNGQTLMRAYKFRVHHRYDSMMKSRELPIPAAQPVAPVQNIQQAPSFTDLLAIIERMFSMMGPLINRPQNENVMDIMNQNYTAMGAMMKKSLMEQFSFMSELSKNFLPGGENMNQVSYNENDEVEETGSSIIEQFAPLLTQFLPMILGNGPQAQLAQNVVKHSPQFQKVVSDKAELNRIIQYLDDIQGPEKTDQVLQALRVKRITEAKRATAPKPTAAGGKKK